MPHSNRVFGHQRRAAHPVRTPYTPSWYVLLLQRAKAAAAGRKSSAPQCTAAAAAAAGRRCYLFLPPPLHEYDMKKEGKRKKGRGGEHTKLAIVVGIPRFPQPFNTFAFDVQGSAKEWSLGCVIPASRPPLSAGARFTQPRDHSLANPCTPSFLIIPQPPTIKG